MKIPEIIEVVIPWEKEYNPAIYQDIQNSYLVTNLKKMGYVVNDFNCSYVKILLYNRVVIYKIEDELHPARLYVAFDKKQDLNIKLIKLYVDSEVHEVTKKQYFHIIKIYAGAVFHREEDDKYFIKFACNKAVKDHIKNYIKNNPG